MLFHFNSDWNESVNHLEISSVSVRTNMLSQKELLDQLMGKDRNLSKDDTHTVKMQWRDREVCRKHLCGFCPNIMFSNTKHDIGPCSMVHDDVLREEYVFSVYISSNMFV